MTGRLLPPTRGAEPARLGVTPETISRWENGHNEADRAVWATLALLVDDHHAGRTATLDRLRGLVVARQG